MLRFPDDDVSSASLAGPSMRDTVSLVALFFSFLSSECLDSTFSSLFGSESSAWWLPHGSDLPSAFTRTDHSTSMEAWICPRFSVFLQGGCCYPHELLFILVEPAGCLVLEVSLPQQRSVHLSIPLINTAPTRCPWIFVAEKMLYSNAGDGEEVTS